MRLTRGQWEDAQLASRPKGEPAKRVRTPATGRRPQAFVIDGKTYTALTRSEARALAKKDTAASAA